MTNAEVYVYSKVVAKTVKKDTYRKARTVRRLIRNMYYNKMITEGQYNYLEGIFFKNINKRQYCQICFKNYYYPEGRDYKYQQIFEERKLR